MDSLIDYGAPPWFDEWRLHQRDAFLFGMMSRKRHVGLGVATGVGKGLLAYLLGKNHKGRACILTSRIGLAAQYKGDFPDVAVIQGRRNYRTRKEYEDALLEAVNAPIVVTNYQYYFFSLVSGRLGFFDTLICDEAALAFNEMSNFLSFNTTREKMAELGLGWPEKPDDPDSWKQWAFTATPKLRRLVVDYQRLHKETDELLGYAAKMSVLQSMRGRWVAESDGYSGLVGRVWPGEDGAKYLFEPGIKKIFYLSGTLRPQSMRLLGVPEDEMVFKEWPHPFPWRIRPVYWIPTIRYVERQMKEQDYQMILLRIDQLINKYQGKLGLLHTVSYARAQMFADRLANRDAIVLHDSRNTAHTVSVFLARKGRGMTSVLASPALQAGWDLGAIDWQAIVKLPFKPATDCITQARMEEDPNYTQYEVAQEIVQQAGRIVRGPNDEDAGVTIIPDDSWKWFGPKNRAAMPGWFKVQELNKLPDLLT